MPTLSKSDFKLASSCAKKLVYKKQKYSSADSANEYLEMLAQGGYIVGKMATLYFPKGIEVSENNETAKSETETLMQQESVVLFEPLFQSGQKLARVDILKKEGNKISIIEVKAKSFDSTNVKLKELAEYIEDVAFQHLIVSELYPNHQIESFLFMPDKSIRTSIDAFAGWFSIEPSDKERVDEELSKTNKKFIKPNVIFKYENHPNRITYIAQLKENGILNYLDVTEDVLKQQDVIKNKVNSFLRILNNGITPDDYSINKSCKGCEYNIAESNNNGYLECWGQLAAPKPHIFDLYFGGSIGHYTKGFYLNELIENKKTSMYDIDFERLKNANGEIGSRASRQMIQIENTKANSEWFSESFSSILDNLKYPLHFIDFETYTGAIPYHKNMRSYELIAFQWSCHTITSKGATPIHSEWIHTGEMFLDENMFPNFEFAKSLMKQIGNNGTPLMWASHENSVLRTILYQMEEYDYQDEDLKNWLIEMTHDKEQNKEGRWVDMNKLTSEHYFHPLMGGRTSIKKVLPAIWSTNTSLHTIPHFSEYKPNEFIEGIIDPYDTLTKGLIFEESEDEEVKGGTDAMRAYQRIRFDNNISSTYKHELRTKLLEYCKLDTMAMVIIANHWGLK